MIVSLITFYLTLYVTVHKPITNMFSFSPTLSTVISEHSLLQQQTLKHEDHLLQELLGAIKE